MNLFGRKRQAAAKQTNDPAQTIMKLRTTVETLEKRQVHLDKQVEKQTAEVRAPRGRFGVAGVAGFVFARRRAGFVFGRAAERAPAARRAREGSPRTPRGTRAR